MIALRQPAISDAIPQNTPSLATFEGGPRQAVLLSPILPAWDEGRYFGPLIPFLQRRGYRVSVFDTLSSHGNSIHELAEDWLTYFTDEFERIDLFGGAALGGSVAQCLLSTSVVDSQTNVILISSPTVANPDLDEKLLELVRLAHDEGAHAALSRLSELVTNQDPESNAPSNDLDWQADAEAARRRLIRGFGALAGINAVDSVRSFQGRLIHLYGQNSGLVTYRNIAAGDTSRHRTIELAGCGMRPLTDQADRVLQEIESHLCI